MVNKLFVFHGDLGAAKNILKNVVMLSSQVHFPIKTDNRLEYFKKEIYPAHSVNDWFSHEYRMKDYPAYGIDMILGDANVERLIHLPPPLKRLMQRTNYAMDLFNKNEVDRVVDLEHVKFLMIYPETQQGVHWQVRAYAMKKSPADVHNFTYMDTDNIQRHRDTYGEESWTKVNLYNFYQNVLEHIQKLKTQPWPFVPLEWILIQDKWNQLIEFLQNHFQVDIDAGQAQELLQAWTNLHWSYQHTDQWEHADIFDGMRTAKSYEMITQHSLA